MNIHLNNEGQECKTGPIRGQILLREKENGEVKEVNIVGLFYILL
jgi:hypothetical protein